MQSLLNKLPVIIQNKDPIKQKLSKVWIFSVNQQPQIQINVKVQILKKYYINCKKQINQKPQSQIEIKLYRQPFLFCWFYSKIKKNCLIFKQYVNIEILYHFLIINTKLFYFVIKIFKIYKERAQSIILFNFTQKPNLTLKDEEQLHSRLQIEQYLTEEDKQGINKEIIIKDLYNAWLQIKFDENKKICKQELNQNINQEIGNEIQLVFSDSVNSENNQKKQKENSSNNKYEQLLNQFQNQ